MLAATTPGFYRGAHASVSDGRASDEATGGSGISATSNVSTRSTSNNNHGSHHSSSSNSGSSSSSNYHHTTSSSIVSGGQALGPPQGLPRSSSSSSIEAKDAAVHLPGHSVQDSQACLVCK